MDLALSIGGCTVTELHERLTSVELGLWAKYAAKKMLPWRRMELHLAQVALQVARLSGNTDASLDDFLFETPDEVELAPEDAAEFFGYSPRKPREGPVDGK